MKDNVYMNTCGCLKPQIDIDASDSKIMNMTGPNLELASNKVWQERSASGIMVSVIDGDIVASEWEVQSRYYVHFRIKTIEKCIKQLIKPVIG